ncbi:type II toxin-antitoxin system RelE/ParE family toxin [Flavobacterium sp. ZT3R18]|uniref:type II toxin-antitoxin system RelE/ParE family toxin n=1 Tax=Flavobacterium sp. ZT3R18 TaxID=2594429 RepID=UPI00117A059B|nr:type II toxin-antitoxin system RelE/ParE family toxin [Flavobacterium sp. ZT3R18]TRX38097.1 type II toxin-antitoxin system RelE/ParE family toxin [Flavobacterium sp. ZT3R18]
MELKLNWTAYSRNELREIFLYYKGKSNLKTAKNIVEEISKEVFLLEKLSFVGKIEELLVDRKEDFRFFFYDNYKIIFYVDLEKNLVEIVDIFDCCQEPLKIKRTK